MDVRRLAVVASLALAGCGDDTDTTPTPDPLIITEGCNPIAADADCLLPYPSDWFITDGKVNVPDVALPLYGENPVDMLALHRPDGFSVGTPILAVLGVPVDDSSLSFWAGDVSGSTTPASQTLLVDAETGALVEHFAEIDPRATDPLKQALIMRPLVRLQGGHRYVVGLQHLTQPGGEAIEAPKGFASLRDNAGKAHPALEALSPHYEADVFPVLEAAGAVRSDLQLAWDFTTRTDDDAMGDMLAIRDDIMAVNADAPPGVTVVSVEDDPSDSIAKRIELTVRVPLYLDSVEPGAPLTSSPPTADSEADVPVTVWIPKSVANRAPTDPPARLLQYGHGFFGDRTEADGFPSQFAEDNGFVIVAADWWGISSADQSFIAGEFITNPENVLVFTDRVHQAMANFMTLAAAAQGPISELPELQVNGEPAYDPATIYFAYGISFGHILGGTYVALSPSIERAALGSGAANFGMLLFRARPFLPLLALLQSQMREPLDHQKFAAMAQSVFERVDPMTYAPHLIESPLPGSPERRICMQMGIADAEVPNLGTYFDARIVGAPLLEGASAEFPSWLPTTTAPASGSALTAFDFGFEPTLEAIPAEESNDVHNDVRELAASQLQVSNFFQPDGEIDNPCRGTCDPE